MNPVSLLPSLFKRLSFLLMGVILFGCASFPDENVDPAKNNMATFKRDVLDCAQAYPETSSGAHVKQRIGCMNLKGWR